jgi:AcrR family transcriptional regulator
VGRNRFVSPGGRRGEGWNLSIVADRSDGIRAGQRKVGAGPRRLDPSRDAAILEAAFDGLAEVGYDRLSMDDIAARAHVGKAAIYRRWSSKADVVVAAMIRWREQMGAVEVPDTGSLRGDAEAIVAMVPDFGEEERDVLGVLLGLATAAARDPALASALRDHALSRPRQALMAVLDRAVARGEIPRDRDLTLVPDILHGLNALRLMTGQPIDKAFVGRVFDDVILPLVTAPMPDKPR